MTKRHRYTRGGELQSLPPLPGQPLRNVVYKFPDLSEFVSSDFFENNQHIITKYLPSKLIYLTVPAYKEFRIWVISISADDALGYHTSYTVDCTKDNFNDICKELDDIGGHNQLVYLPYYDAQKKADSIARNNQSDEVYKNGITKGYNEGYNEGYTNQPQEDNSAWGSFKNGLMLPINLAASLL